MNKKIIAIGTVIFLIGAIVFWIVKAAPSQSKRTVSQKLTTPTSTPNSTQQMVGKPVLLKIPRIDVSAKIEPAGLDMDGNMATPKDWNNTSWYQEGTMPGEVGSAVLAGHLDNEMAEPAIFSRLKELKPEDTFQVEDEHGTSRTFIVTEVKNYDLATAPLERIFNDATGKKVNLITCAGTWDKNKSIYSKRLVVYGEMKDK